MQPEVANDKPKATIISAEAYNTVIEQLVPLDVRLADLTFTVKAPVHSGPLSASAELSLPVLGSRTDAPDGAEFVLIEHAGTFKIAASDESVAAEGRAIFVVRVKVGFKAPDNFWPVFMQRNVRLYTHPALRDLLASLAARASLVAQPLGSVAITQAIKPALPSTPKLEALPPSPADAKPATD